MTQCDIKKSKDFFNSLSDYLAVKLSQLKVLSSPIEFSQRHKKIFHGLAQIIIAHFCNKISKVKKSLRKSQGLSHKSKLYTISARTD